TEGSREVHSPISGEIIARVRSTDAVEARAAIGRSAEAFRTWRLVPAPVRGELIRQLGNELRGAKEGLGRLVTIETGKILS
ncbi:MAG: aldehyde dehydrogenase family protein, partial [Alphaproteobacteria bacterium]